MKSLILKTTCLALVAMLAHFGIAFADESEVAALKNELKSMKTDLADLKGQMHAMQLNKPTSPAPAYVAPVNAGENKGLLHLAQEINMGGYVDVQWNQNFNDGFKNNQINDLRSYDVRKDSFTVNQALLWFEKPVTDSGQAGFRIDMLMGDDARIQAADGYDGDAFDLLQAYAEYKLPVTVFGCNEYLPKWVDFKVGRMLTLAGFETIKAPDNWEVSRGVLYGFATPVTHTGIRTNFKVWKDMIDLYFGINNGWDQAVDANSEKTLEFGMGYEPIKNVKVLHALYLGQENAGGATNDLASNRFLTSNVVTWTATDKLSLAGELDFGTSRGVVKYDTADATDGNWFGLGGHARYQLTKRFAPYYRMEWMMDESKTRFTNGTSGLTDDLLTNTFGAEYKLTDNLLTRSEYRFDKAVGNNAYDGKFSQEQTLEGQVIYMIG